MTRGTLLPIFFSAMLAVVGTACKSGADPNTDPTNKDTCGASDVTWAQVQPILESSCWSCHSNAAAAANVKLEEYQDVVDKVNDGSFIPSIERIPPRTPMPPATPLTECEVTVLNAWVSQGLRP